MLHTKIFGRTTIFPGSVFFVFLAIILCQSERSRQVMVVNMILSELWIIIINFLWALVLFFIHSLPVLSLYYRDSQFETCGSIGHKRS